MARIAVRNWLRPRVKIAWAERRLVEAVQGLPETADSAVKSNRERWIDFVNSDLGTSLRNYDSAETVAETTGRHLSACIPHCTELNSSVKARPWVPTLTLRAALDDLYNQPNLDIAADVFTLTPFLEHDVAITGPVSHKGYLSQVTAGQKTGFGLLPSNDGIAFYNRQQMTSVTPVWDFNNQMASDPRGQRATKLYHFDATTIDQSELTITAVISDQGLSLFQNYRHNTDACITAAKTEGNGLGRTIAALIGMNQAKITQKVYEGAIGRIREGVITDSIEVGGEKLAEEQAKVNQQIREYLLGNHKLSIRNLLISGLMLRSQPERALIGGFLSWNGAADQVGAYAPQPSRLDAQPRPGRVGRPASDLDHDELDARLSPERRRATGREPDGGHEKGPARCAPLGGGRSLAQRRLPDVPESGPRRHRVANDPEGRGHPRQVSGPRAWKFAADANGYLVALVHDFVLEVPAPPQALKGGLFGPPAQVYRFTSPQAEFVISFKITPQTEKEPVRLSGRIESFDPGPQAKVYAVNEDEGKAEPPHGPYQHGRL